MTFTSVVIGVDFSPALSGAGAWIRRFIAPSASITLVHAHDPTPLPPFLRALVPPDTLDGSSDLRSAEDQLVAWRDDNGIEDAKIVVEAARPHELIERVARQTHADLVVIGAHGGRERPWQRIGSTAERLLRTAESSLIVVHGRPREAPRKLLVAVDDVGITPRVLGVAGELADRLDASLVAVHVLSNAAYSHILSIEAAHSRTPAESREKVAADIAEEALRWLTALWKNTMRHDKLDAQIRHGVAGDEILIAAVQIHAELIVMGRYGIGRVVPAVLGSVVGSVVHGAACPVLVVADSSVA
jgi:nucleotide-binding universal stress UspA family protein